MALNTAAQFEQALSTVQSVLVLLRPNPSVDEVSAALATVMLIRRSGKQAIVVSHNYTQSPALKFLPLASEIKSEVGQLQDLTISIQLPSGGIEYINHDVVDGKAIIKIAPKSGSILPQDISMHNSQFRFDMIIVIGAQDLVSLGETYSKNTSLFNALPIVTIDCSPANEQFGHINFIDITLSSVAEVVYSLFTQIRSEITAPIAQLLLTGMVAATQSFKTRNVNAQTLQTASALISLGADRELIVHHLYRQRSVAALKLWGIALSHLQNDQQLPLMWSSLTREDFARSGATISDLRDLMSELIYTAPHAKVFALVYENPDAASSEITIALDAQRPHDAQKLLSGFVNVTGTRDHAEVVIRNTQLSEAIQKISNVLRAKMRD